MSLAILSRSGEIARNGCPRTRTFPILSEQVWPGGRAHWQEAGAVYISERPRQDTEGGGHVARAESTGRADRRAPRRRQSAHRRVVGVGVGGAAAVPHRGVGLTPLAYGFIDGLYQGVSALVRILGGWYADRTDRPKWVAFAGYGMSALTKLLLVPLHGFVALTAVITVDRLGKGLRTAPRDALIAAATPPSRWAARSVSTGPSTRPARPSDRWSPSPSCGSSPATTPRSSWPLSPPPFSGSRSWASSSRTCVHVGRAATPSESPSARPSAAMARAGMGRLIVAAALLSVLAISDGFLYLSLQQRDDFRGDLVPSALRRHQRRVLRTGGPHGPTRRPDRAAAGPRRWTRPPGRRLPGRRRPGRAGSPRPSSACCSSGAFYAATDGVLAALTASLVPPSVRAVGYRHHPDRGRRGAVRLVAAVRGPLGDPRPRTRGLRVRGAAVAGHPGCVVAAAEPSARPSAVDAPPPRDPGEPPAPAGGARGPRGRSRRRHLDLHRRLPGAAVAAVRRGPNARPAPPWRPSPVSRGSSSATPRWGRSTGWSRWCRSPMSSGPRAYTTVACDRVFATKRRHPVPGVGPRHRHHLHGDRLRRRAPGRRRRSP